MSKQGSKVLFFFLVVLYLLYVIGVFFYTDFINVEMASPLVELYGFISGFIVILVLYSHAFSQRIFNAKALCFIAVNTAMCALFSYLQTIYNDFHFMSAFEVSVYTLLYFLIYPPIFDVIFTLKRLE